MEMVTFPARIKGSRKLLMVTSYSFASMSNMIPCRASILKLPGDRSLSKESRSAKLKDGNSDGILDGAILTVGAMDGSLDPVGDSVGDFVGKMLGADD